MKTRSWILVISFAVVLGSLLAYGQFGLSGAHAKSGAPMVGMGDFKKVENQKAIPMTGKSGSRPEIGMADLRKFENQQERLVNGQHESSLQVRMGDFRAFEASQNVRLGMGDLRKIESGQIRTGTVGIGDLRRIEQGNK